MALVGRIARPHGLRGQVVVNPETDFIEERFAAGATVWTRSAAGDERLTIASVRLQNGRPVVGFDGFDAIEDVERLAGTRAAGAARGAAAAAGGHVTTSIELVGCAVETHGGDVGRRRWRKSKAAPAQPAGDGRAARRDPDSARGRHLRGRSTSRTGGSVIDPPEGLLNVNVNDERGRHRHAICVRHRHDLSGDDRGGSRKASSAGRSQRGALDVMVHDLRDFTTDRHRSVDDVPYGGGPGMVMKPEPLFRAVEAIRGRRGTPDAVILLSPQGTRFTQAEAERLSRRSHLVLLCGRYEGMDERVPELRRRPRRSRSAISC